MVHKKKHDMVLNLGLVAKGNTYSDQTPTPTQFIRNCEEVGLFQDLQNVNPFEETFKKAAEAVKTGHTSVLDKSFQSNPCDDTLHTPNVFPHITILSSGNHNANIVKTEVKHLEDNLPKKGDVNNANERELHPKTALEPNKSDLENINHKRRKVSLCDKYVVKEVQTDQNLIIRSENKGETCLKSVPSSNAIANDSNQVQMAIKEKIKNNIHNKQMPLLIQLKVPIPKSKSMSRCQKSQKDRFSTFSKNSLKFDSNGERSESSVFDVNKKRNIRKNYSGLSKEKIDILERNRAAATRCREKKKIYVSYLEKLNRELTDSNRKLIHHNSYLKKQVSLLQTELLKHQNCIVSNSKEESITASIVHVDTACKSTGQFEMGREISTNVQNRTASQENSRANEEIESTGAVSNSGGKISSSATQVVSGGGGGSSSNNINNESFTLFYSKPCSMKSFYEDDRLRKVYIDHSYFNFPYLTNSRKKYPNACGARSKSNPGLSTMNARNQNFIDVDDKTVDASLSQTESILEVQTQEVTF